MSKRTIVILCLIGLVVAGGLVVKYAIIERLPKLNIAASFSLKAIVETDGGNIIISGGASDLMVTDPVTGETEWQPQISYHVVDTSGHDSSGSDLPVKSLAAVWP